MSRSRQHLPQAQIFRSILIPYHTTSRTRLPHWRQSALFVYFGRYCQLPRPGRSALSSSLEIFEAVKLSAVQICKNLILRLASPCMFATVEIEEAISVICDGAKGSKNKLSGHCLRLCEYLNFKMKRKVKYPSELEDHDFYCHRPTVLMYLSTFSG